MELQPSSWIKWDKLSESSLVQLVYRFSIHKACVGCYSVLSNVNLLCNGIDGCHGLMVRLETGLFEKRNGCFGGAVARNGVERISCCGGTAVGRDGAERVDRWVGGSVASLCRLHFVLSLGLTVRSLDAVIDWRNRKSNLKTLRTALVKWDTPNLPRRWICF